MSYKDLQDIYNKSKIGDKIGRLIFEQLYVNKEIRESSLILDSPYERFENLIQTKKDWALRVPQYHLGYYLMWSPKH